MNGTKQISETAWTQWILTVVLGGVFSLTGYIAYLTVQLKSDVQVVKAKIEMFERHEAEQSTIINELNQLERRVDMIEYKLREDDD